MNAPRLTDEHRRSLEWMVEGSDRLFAYERSAIRAVLAEIDANRKDAERLRAALRQFTAFPDAILNWPDDFEPQIKQALAALKEGT